MVVLDSFTDRSKCRDFSSGQIAARSSEDLGSKAREQLDLSFSR
jgi:hypothetical protein